MLLLQLKTIWLLNDQLCGKLHKAALPHWLESYEHLQGPLPQATRTLLFSSFNPTQVIYACTCAEVVRA